MAQEVLRRDHQSTVSLDLRKCAKVCQLDLYLPTPFGISTEVQNEGLHNKPPPNPLLMRPDSPRMHRHDKKLGSVVVNPCGRAQKEEVGVPQIPIHPQVHQHNHLSFVSKSSFSHQTGQILTARLRISSYSSCLCT